MNTVVETINGAGKTFVDFALPMLIQSGVLVVILLVVDAVLRKRVRAVFRYWIWILVLVKLVLPPSLGSPVSIGRWLGDPLKVPTAAVLELDESGPAAPLAEPRSIAGAVLSQAGRAAVTTPALVVEDPDSEARYSSGAGIKGGGMPGTADAEPAPVATAPSPIQSPALSLRWEGLVLLSWAAVAAALLLLLQRAFFVRGLVAQAEDADAAMRDRLDSCRVRIGLKREVALRLSAVAGSPAACGLIHPVILIPQNLAPRLEAHDLHAVLLHELAHIKRGDLWVNLIQTLLQIIYFYNPLLWLANAMIRRTREQAVDEAVLVAMGDTAPQYPETLVTIARLAFRKRPAMSLRLVGVVESKSALSSRIKHILTRPLPKTARLGLLGAMVILIIAAVTLPMTKARTLTDRAGRIMALAAEEARALNHRYLGTEHILLALARQDDAVSAQVLQSLGLDSERVKAEILKYVQPGPVPVTGGRLAPTARAGLVLEYAEQEARSLRHDYIGTEHILLALLREKNSVAAQVLQGLGVTAPRAREAVLRFVQPGHATGTGADDANDARAPLTAAAVVPADKGTGGGALVKPGGPVAKLPNGVTVTLLAYSRLDGAGLEWWTLQGLRTTIPAVHEADVEGHGSLLALRIEPQPEAGVFAWFFQPPDIRYGLKPVWRVNDSDIWLVPLGEGRNYANVEVTAQVRDPVVLKPVVLTQPSSGGALEIGQSRIGRITDVQRVDANSMAFTVQGLSGVPPQAGPHVVAALDTSRQVHSMRRIPLGQPDLMDIYGGGPQRFQVDVPVDRFVGVVVEGYSERAGSVKFRNLSLRPGQPAEIHVEVAAQEQGPWWHDSGYTSQLEHLGRVLSDYAKENAGGYPVDLPAMRAFFEDTTWKWLQEHVVYLGAGKSSTGAGAVPLAYEKTLLPFGFGTYVLYSDRGVEFQAPAKLMEIGIATDRARGAEAAPDAGRNMKQLGLAVVMYADEHNGALPATLSVLSPYLPDPQVLEWLKENVTYTGKGNLKDYPAAQSAVTAYEKTPQPTGERYVLFLDAHVELARPERLKELTTVEPAGQRTDELARLVKEAQLGATITLPKGTYRTAIEIAKPMVLRGESQEGCIVEVTADQPAILINTGGKGDVTIENVTVRWQMATEARIERPVALLVKDTNATIRNCRFVPLGDAKRSPMAVYIDGRSKSTVDNCRFSGFEYTICYGQGTEGVVQDCIIMDCGHQGVINYDGSTLTVQRNIITGSKFHAVRCTGGTLHVKDNLLMKNANRGIYLGNKTGRGTITNNLIVGNGTGISAFGRADYAIANNVIVNNKYAGVDMRDSCRLSIRNNALAKNQRGIALYKEGTENFNVIGKNAYWANATDVESMDKPEGSITADPQFADPNRGDFTVRGPVQEQGHGLTNPSVIRELWEKLRQLPRTELIESSMRGGVQDGFNIQPAQLRQMLLAGDSNARRAVFEGIRQRKDIMTVLDASFLPAMWAAATDSDPSVRNEVASAVGFRWVWHAENQDANAIELLLKLSSDSDRRARYNAVYYGLSNVRNAGEPVIRRLIEMAMADHENNLYDRIVWGLKGPLRAAPDLVAKILAEYLDSAKSGVHGAGSIYSLYRDVLEKEPPVGWDLARIKDRYADNLFAVPFSAKEPFKPQNDDALWSELAKSLPQGVTAEPLRSGRQRGAIVCVANVRGKEQADAVKGVIEDHPRLSLKEIYPLSLSAQLYLEEMAAAARP